MTAAGRSHEHGTRGHEVVGITRLLTATAGLWAAALLTNRSLWRVRGPSMAPTLDQGDIVLTTPMRRPRRGDVVLLRGPDELGQGGRIDVKRVVGLPGESVTVRGGRLLIDGVPHREDYAVAGGPDGGLLVPADRVVVLGDARASSTDSRSYGAVPVGLLTARVVARVLPRPALLTAAPRAVESRTR